MAFFTKEFTGFLKDLSKNNSTGWFNENRKRYETHVKKPFVDFVTDVIGRIQKVDPSVQIKPADAITRINKDIRFSKDKTPYNTYVGAVISATGKKDKSVPGLYIQLSYDKVTLYGGAYVLDPAQLKLVRRAIASDPSRFAELYRNSGFKRYFGNVKGEQAKRLDAEWQLLSPREPLIANKQFYFTAELQPAMITHDDLAQNVVDHYKAAHPLNQFFFSALKKK